LAASTIPTDNGFPIVVNPASGYTNFSEYLTMIWLLDGQSSPMADGSINAPYVPGSPLTVSVSATYPNGSGTPSPDSFPTLLPAATAPASYILSSFELEATTDLTYLGAGNTFTITIGALSYSVPNGTAVANGAGTFPLGNLAGAGAVSLTLPTTTVGNGAGTVNMSLNYFLVSGT
jgi:hypothetical protein